MGILYELRLADSNLRELPSKPFYFKTLGRGERELYSDPAISPDSQSVAFAVHAVSGNDRNDLVGLSGPLAVMDLGSGQRRVLLATKDIAGQGSAFVNDPVWSSDGRRLLIAFEAGGGITDVGGQQLQLLGDLMMKPFSDGVASPVAWWSSDEILFVWNPRQESGIGRLHLLNLRDCSVVDAAAVLRVPKASTHEVLGVQINSRFILLQHRDDAELFSRQGQLLRRWPNGTVRLRP